MGPVPCWRDAPRAVVTEPPRAVLFDLDGVLIESYNVWFELMSAAARDLGYPPLDAQQFRASFGQSVEDDRRMFYPRHSAAELASYYAAHFADHLDHLTIAEGVTAVFEHLAERQIPSVVVTNTPSPLGGELVAHIAATPETVIGGNDVPLPKPAPDMLLRACEMLGVEPDQAVMVGDSRFDREAARAAGCRFIGVGIDGDARIERLVELLDHL